MSFRLLFLDLVGTLVGTTDSGGGDGPADHRDSFWYQLMETLGPDALDDQEKTISRWENGEYDSYLDWAAESASVLRKHGLTRDRFRELLDRYRYHSGVKRTIRSLHEQGVKTAIVSGGFYNQARRVQRDLRITHAFAAIDLYWDDRGELTHWNLFPSDYEGKIDFVRLLIREYGLDTRECAFVGDGQNDVAIAREVGTSFAYRAHPRLRREATYSLDAFPDLLDHLP